jgi:hypothetical protein
LDLHPDYDTAVRCLEFIRQNFTELFSSYGGMKMQLIALCHHSSSNVYPALGVISVQETSSSEVLDDIDGLTDAIDQWVTEISVPRLVEMSRQVVAPSWQQLMAGPNSRFDADAQRRST